jgi:hypothetical protein
MLPGPSRLSGGGRDPRRVDASGQWEAVQAAGARRMPGTIAQLIRRGVLAGHGGYLVELRAMRSAVSVGRAAPRRSGGP